LPFSLYMPYLITRGFVFLQIIFFVGAILFISNYGKIKDNWKNFIFLIIVFFLLLNNFTYLLSDDNNYGSSNDIRIKEGLSLFLEQITEEDKISSDLKVLSNSLVLGHENSYLPFTSESDSEFEELLNRIFYYNNPEEIYQELKDNGVDYFILTEEMTKYGIYVHDYQHPAISEELINILKEDERFNLVFDNEGLFIFQLT